MTLPPLQTGRISVRLVCVAKGVSFDRMMRVPKGQALGWCVNASGLYGLHPDVQGAKMGLWGKALPPETPVREGDRIEVYMPASKEAAAKARSRRALAVAPDGNLRDNGE